MVTSMMDDGESLHKRRQWISQYQLPKMHDMGHHPNVNERQSRIPFRLAFSRDNMKKYITSRRSRFGVVATILTIAFMALNLNQGPALKGYVDSTRVFQPRVQNQPETQYINQNHGGGLRSLERSQSSNCKKTPFVTPQEAAHSMPGTPAWYPDDQPSHIALCEELIRRNDLVAQTQAQEGEASGRSSPFTTYLVQESPAVCTDWSKPHSALMQLISSSIVAYVGERFGLEYRHNCHNDLSAEYRRNLPFDVTTVQDIFPELKMPIDQKVVNLGNIVHELCTDCIEGYRNNKHTYGFSEATHHCLAFPDRGAVQLGYVNEQVMGRNGMPEMVEKQELLDSQGFVFHTALESVVHLVRNRLWHAARDWQKEAVIPRGDPKTGVIIYIDAGTSLPIPFNLYTKQIPEHATRVDIISSPTCATGNLAISMTQLQPLSCLKHGSELRDYLHNYFKDDRVDVGFKMMSSTAAAYSRMIQVNTLICPPETLSCLLPALAKEKVKNAIIFESPESTTYNWFPYLGTAVENINVIKLNHEEMIIDKEQEFIEAKYAGFRIDQVVGQKPADYQPLPQVPQQNYNTDNSRVNTNYNQGSSNTDTGSGAGTTTFPNGDKPDLNPSVDTFVNGGNTSSSKEREVPKETSHLFEKEPNHGNNHHHNHPEEYNQHDQDETDVDFFYQQPDTHDDEPRDPHQDKHGDEHHDQQHKMESDVGKNTNSEPEETEISMNVAKNVDSAPKETDVTVDYELLGMDTGEELDHNEQGTVPVLQDQEETDVRSDGRGANNHNTNTNNGPEETSFENSNSLFDREGFGDGNEDENSRSGGDTNVETDVDINYQNLFENWR